MIKFGSVLLAALCAGLLYWLVDYVLTKLSLPNWVVMILSGATLVYAFWIFTNLGPITIGH